MAAKDCSPLTYVPLILVLLVGAFILGRATAPPDQRIPSDSERADIGASPKPPGGSEITPTKLTAASFDPKDIDTTFAWLLAKGKELHAARDNDLAYNAILKGMGFDKLRGTKVAWKMTMTHVREIGLVERVGEVEVHIEEKSHPFRASERLGILLDVQASGKYSREHFPAFDFQPTHILNEKDKDLEGAVGAECFIVKKQAWFAELKGGDLIEVRGILGKCLLQRTYDPPMYHFKAPLIEPEIHRP